jgi:4-diphosphocytidyl-2-C-methyl-D-erythritol kinase
MFWERAPAKVNLYLRVTGRRADGYHLLDSLAVFAPAADLLCAELDEAGPRLELRGPFAPALACDPDNLVLRAARLLAETAGVAPPRARLVLDKRLPVASGIGGGSADAAAALRLLARLWDVAMPPDLAPRLGADVPVCLAAPRPARMGGIGERLGPAPHLPPFGLLLANPGVAVSTPSVFRARAVRADGFSEPAALPLAWPSAAAMAADLAPLGNDLEAPAIALCPAIADALAWLRARPGCLLARMSGSGATCFGLFADGGEAEAGAKGAPPGWWADGGWARRSAEGFTPTPAPA